MCLGALLDAGLDFSLLREELKALKLTGYSLTAEKVVKKGISATKAEVCIHGEDHCRGLEEIKETIESSDLCPPVKQKACRVFEKLVAAEARVHGVAAGDAHLHEAGAVDALVDIVGTVLGLHLLGIERVFVSPLPLGGGTIHCGHGILPVPAPAVLELIKGMPTAPSPSQTELVTPTGAALAVSLAERVGSMPPMTIERVGYGAGTMDLPHANILRMVTGELLEEEELFFAQKDEVAVLETTLDDMNPELFSPLGDTLFAAGALDYFLTPVYMKKNRPGVKVTVLCPIEVETRVARLLLEETTSLGCRLRHESRVKAERHFISVHTTYGNVKVKYSLSTGTIAPEFAECQDLAAAAGVPVKIVYDAALAMAWEALNKKEGNS